MDDLEEMKAKFDQAFGKVNNLFLHVGETISAMDEQIRKNNREFHQFANEIKRLCLDIVNLFEDDERANCFKDILRAYEQQNVKLDRQFEHIIKNVSDVLCDKEMGNVVSKVMEDLGHYMNYTSGKLTELEEKLSRNDYIAIETEISKLKQTMQISFRELGFSLEIMKEKLCSMTDNPDSGSYSWEPLPRNFVVSVEEEQTNRNPLSLRDEFIAAGIYKEQLDQLITDVTEIKRQLVTLNTSKETRKDQEAKSFVAIQLPSNAVQIDGSLLLKIVLSKKQEEIQRRSSYAKEILLGITLLLLLVWHVFTVSTGCMGPVPI